MHEDVHQDAGIQNHDVANIPKLLGGAQRRRNPHDQWVSELGVEDILIYERMGTHVPDTARCINRLRLLTLD